MSAIIAGAVTAVAAVASTVMSSVAQGKAANRQQTQFTQAQQVNQTAQTQANYPSTLVRLSIGQLEQMLESKNDPTTSTALAPWQLNHVFNTLENRKSKNQALELQEQNLFRQNQQATATAKAATTAAEAAKTVSTNRKTMLAAIQTRNTEINTEINAAIKDFQNKNLPANQNTAFREAATQEAKAATSSFLRSFQKDEVLRKQQAVSRGRGVSAYRENQITEANNLKNITLGNITASSNSITENRIQTATKNQLNSINLIRSAFSSELSNLTKLGNAATNGDITDVNEFYRQLNATRTSNATTNANANYNINFKTNQTNFREALQTNAGSANVNNAYRNFQLTNQNAQNAYRAGQNTANTFSNTALTAAQIAAGLIPKPKEPKTTPPKVSAFRQQPKTSFRTFTRPGSNLVI